MALMIALSSAVAGLKSQQTALDVVANNIANVNTTAYKSQTVTFSDMLSQTISAASGATATTGGVNPSQIGLGVQVASTDTDMTVGSSSATSNSTDVALTGDGYFVVQTTTAGDHQYTRAGNLKIDEDGNLNIDGYEVCGWEAYTLDADGNKVYTTTGAVEPINVYNDDYSGNKKVMAAKTTTSADVTGNLSTSAEVVTGATLQNIGSTAITTWDKTATMDVVDEQGNKTEVTLNFKKCATDDSTTSWYWEASAADTTISPSSGYIAFDSDGKMVTSVTPLTAAVTSNTSTATPAQDTFTAAVSAAGDSAVTTAYSNYTAALTSGDADEIVSTKTLLDSAIAASTVTGAATLQSALTTYNTAAGTAINTDATALTTAITNAATAQTTFGSAVTAASDSAVTTAYSNYTTALTSGDADEIVSTKTLLDSAIAASTVTGAATLQSALTTYNTAAGTAINTDATALTTATTNAATATTGYSASDISMTTGLAAGNYTVAVAASTTSTGTYDITLTDATGKTYTTNSADGSATFTTASGTVTLAAPTTLAAGTMTFSVTEGTAVTFDSSPSLVVTSTTAGTNGVSVEMDLSKLGSTGTTSSLTVDEDGYEAGTLTGSYTIGTDGTISATYSNGKTQSIGQIALAVFENASGLEKTGGNLYTTTTNSGDYQFVVAGQNGSGTMTSYALELSNVDLASQFSAMMISQRAYQANSKIISTSDDMLQSLINMVG